MFSALNQARGGSSKASNAGRSGQNTKTVKVVKRAKLKSEEKRPYKVTKISTDKKDKQDKLIKQHTTEKLQNETQNDDSNLQENIETHQSADHLSPESEKDSDSDNDWEQNFGRLSSSTPAPESNGNILGNRSILDVNAENFTHTDIKNAEDFIIQHDKEYRSDFGNLKYGLELPFGEEKYLAASPIDREDFDPLAETERVMNMMAQYFVPEQYSRTIKDPQMRDCIVRRFKRAVREHNAQKLKDSTEEYCQLMKKIKSNGQIINQIKKMTAVPSSLVTELLNQVYARVVSPRSKQLRGYEAFSDNVYGELLPKFVRQIFNDTQLLPEDTFVDLGSGVGNCVLQASLEIGCESWGCEVMEIAGELALEQQREFESRISAYGLSHGEIHFLRQNFLESPEIKSVLGRANTVLVNNYAFSASLNNDLINMFLDLKDGCKIISLKSFVPPGHVISAHNIESPINILTVEKKQFGSNSVSWTDAGGDYFISTIDRSRLSKYV